MSMDDSKPGGLLSRIVDFLRHPMAHWSDGDVPDDPLGQVDRQMLRQTLERKRRNDLVRQREFEQLRRLRQQATAAGAEPQAQTASQLASPPSSLAPPSARTATLQKIDAIEEQMSQQWWCKKQPADASTMPMHLLSTFPQPDSVHVQAESASAGLDWRVDPGATQERPAPSSSFATTLQLDLCAWSASAWQEPAADEPFVHDPDFEEAAIAFANGNAAGAEAALQDLLAQRAAEPELQHPVWGALFDLYRVCGLAERFERLASDFGVRYGRPGPRWFSLPESGVVTPGVATPGVVTPGVATPNAAGEHSAHDWCWAAPPVLTRAAVAALQQGKAAAPAPWTLLWGALERIEADAVASLEQVFCEWAQMPGQLVFMDAPVLAQCLQALTASGEHAAPEAGWRLRMAALRLMEQPDSFELVALDYCVTYEVAPPTWTPPRSSYRDGQAGLLPEGIGPMALPAGARLAGSIEGDATPWLAAIEGQARPGLPLVVDCAELVRVDFAAAGAVLNWAARMQDRGVALRFERLHQLAAVFFAMVGIGEHAQLVPRAD